MSVNYVDKTTVDGVSYDYRDSGAVRFDEEQSLTSAQKSVAQGNIGAASEDVISVQSAQPTASGNRIWIQSGDGDEVEVPDIDEFNDLKSQVNTFYNESVVTVDNIYDNRYINSNGGALVYSTNYSLTDAIHLDKGDILIANCFTSSSVAAIAVYRSDVGAQRPTTPLVIGHSDPSGVHETDYTYLATAPIDVFVSYHNNYSCTIKKKAIRFDIKKNVIIIKDSADQFSVYSYHAAKNKYMRHTFYHGMYEGTKTSTGAIKKTMDVWFPKSIYDNDDMIAQGNANFIHNIRDNGINIGYSGAGDGSCVALWTKFFVDGNAYDFESKAVGDVATCDVFRFTQKAENYLCAGGGTITSADYVTVLDSDGSPIVESINDIDYEITGDSKIQLRNRLHIKRNSTQFYECHGAMCCGYYPFFDNVIAFNDEDTWNSYVMSDETWTDTLEGGSTIDLPYTSVKGDTVVMFGDKYRITNKMIQMNSTRYGISNMYLKRYTDGRIKMYQMPVIAHISTGTTETFNDGDILDVMVYRQIDISE